MSEALEVIKLLSDGIDPETGELLTDNHIFNNPKVIRSLFVAIKALEHSIKTNRRRKLLPENAGKPWTEDEDSQLIEEFDKGENMAQLSKHHLRTKGAITARLVRLGKINDSFRYL